MALSPSILPQLILFALIELQRSQYQLSSEWQRASYSEGERKRQSLWYHVKQWSQHKEWESSATIDAQIGQVIVSTSSTLNVGIGGGPSFRIVRAGCVALRLILGLGTTTLRCGCVRTWGAEDPGRSEETRCALDVRCSRSRSLAEFLLDPSRH